MDHINIGTYIEKNLMKIKGYNYNWISMISSSPILFEDVNYLKVQHYVNNTITEQEKEAYADGRLRKLYMNFETMIMDNLEYYDRIISYCTMMFLDYICVDEVPSKKNIPAHTLSFDITPTKIWCAALCNTSSTQFELEYGWDIKCVLLNNNESLIRNNFHILKRNRLFSVFISYRALINNTSGYRETYLSDITPDNILYQVCKKYTQHSSVIGFDQMFELEDYIDHEEENVRKLHDSISQCMDVLYENNKDIYAVFVFNDEFYVHTHNFGMRVFKKDGSISKDYISNSYECFVAEPFMKPSIKKQIEWCKYTLPHRFIHVRDILRTLLLRLLDEDFKNVVCIKRMHEETETTSYVTFTGIFENVYIKEKFFHKKEVVKEYTKCMSKENAAKYLTDKGYYIFGFREDVDRLLHDFETNPYQKATFLKNHYNKYCINIKDFMKDVVSSYRAYNREIINYVLNGVPSDKICSEIKVTTLKGLASRDVKKVIKTININIKKHDKNDTKSYYDIISE